MPRFFCIKIFCDVPICKMCLHECKLIFWKKGTRKSGRMHFWQLKMQQLPPAYTVMYLQTKPNEQLKPMIFSDKENESCIYQNCQNLSYWKIFCNLSTQMYTKKIEEKVPGKVGECIFDSQKCKSFQGPKVGPGLRPIFYGSLHLPDFALLRRQNIGKNFWAPPLDQILDPLLLDLHTIFTFKVGFSGKQAHRSKG